MNSCHGLSSLAGFYCIAWLRTNDHVAMLTHRKNICSIGVYNEPPGKRIRKTKSLKKYVFSAFEEPSANYNTTFFAMNIYTIIFPDVFKPNNASDLLTKKNCHQKLSALHERAIDRPQDG